MHLHPNYTMVHAEISQVCLFNFLFILFIKFLMSIILFMYKYWFFVIIFFILEVV